MSSQVDLQQLEQRCIGAIEAKIGALGDQLRALVIIQILGLNAVCALNKRDGWWVAQLVQANGHSGNAATESGDDAQKSHDKLMHQQALAVTQIQRESVCAKTTGSIV